VPRNALDNHLVLPLLGLLIEQPAHPYELTQRLAVRYPSLEARRSSVTTLVGSLAAAGLVTAQRRKRVARRPARTTYELTEAGYDLVRQRVTQDLVSARPATPALVLALSYIAILPVRTATATLRKRLSVLEGDLRSASAAHALPEYQMLEMDYWRDMLRADIAWIRTLIDRLDGGAIEWPRTTSRGKHA